MLLFLIFGLVFSSAALLSWQLYPVGAKVVTDYHTQQVKQATHTLDKMFLNVPPKKLLLMYILTPLALGISSFIFIQRAVAIPIGLAFGIVLPALVLKIMDKKRIHSFNRQLIDGLMVLSSSLKGGLSLLQSIEVLVEEMPAPINQEFALVLRENQMGVPLDESLENLNKRVQSEELTLIVTAIDIARETGGNLTEPFEKLMFTLRERDKLIGKVKTLTLQAKLQGVIMSLMPVAFGILVYYTNREFFNLMLEDPRGHMMLVVAGCLEVAGAVLLYKLSRVDI